MKKFLHDWIGVGAAAMVAAALVYFLSPWAEGVLGPERTRMLQFILIGVFAVYGLIYLFRFLGLINRHEE